METHRAWHVLYYVRDGKSQVAYLEWGPSWKTHRMSRRMKEKIKQINTSKENDSQNLPQAYLICNCRVCSKKLFINKDHASRIKYFDATKIINKNVIETPSFLEYRTIRPHNTFWMTYFGIKIFNHVWLRMCLGQGPCIKLWVLRPHRQWICEDPPQRTHIVTH